ncbi:acylaminoacyl-peptidase [Rheinheimera pacifica]|uniref:alpha/beta hydrolase family protein n=1 Tax=Rheinheimera pacifica TaxID=173990 RepID=UPI0028596840|nr:S9 family peptidase [Rheinheimera pacifica]MDR6985349.1 acylaminoacyl-peptidase [Rheinheimera pacifica]
MKKTILLSMLFSCLPIFAAEISLQDYARHAQFMDVKISPTGKYLGTTGRADDGNVQLIVIDREKMQIVSQQHFRGSDSINQFYWANNERLVITLAKELGSLESPVSTGELFAMNADGKQRIMLTGHRAARPDYSTSRVINWLPDEDDFVLVSNYSWRSNKPTVNILRLNIKNGRSRWVDQAPMRASPGRGVDVITDNTGIARFALGMDLKNDDEIVAMYRKEPTADWQELARYDINAGLFSPMMFHHDQKHIIGMSNLSSDTMAVSLLDPETGKETILAQHPRADLAPVVSIEDGQLSEIIGASYEYDELSAAFFEEVKDKKFSAVIQSLVAAFPGQSVQITSGTRDNKLLVVTVFSANKPKDFYLYDTEKRSVGLLVSGSPWLREKPLPLTEIVIYKNRDGQDIQALLTLPKGKEAKNLPLIMLPHGGPHGPRDSISAMDRDAKVLAENGYAVLQPNFRGSGGFGRTFEQSGYRNWGTTMINDMTDGVMHLVSKGIVDQSRVCAYGGSYGGYAALMSAIREPELYKCTVGFVGVFDLNLMYTDGDIPKSKSGIAYLEKVLGRDIVQLDAQSPLKQLDKLKAPVFIIHGEEDMRVPIIQAKRLREELEKRNHPYEWLVVAKEGHGFYKPENNVERWQKMLVFFDKYIGQSKPQ